MIQGIPEVVVEWSFRGHGAGEKVVTVRVEWSVGSTVA
jgi:hypothetical protein